MSEKFKPGRSNTMDPKLVCTKLVFIDQEDKIKRIVPLDTYPVLRLKAGILLLFNSSSDEYDKDPYVTRLCKRLHIAGDGIGIIVYNNELKEGCCYLVSITSRYLVIRNEGRGSWYVRAESNIEYLKRDL
jgi:hypothetical protein